MRRILVTGGGTGIGKAIAQCFADAGDEVTIAGRTEATLKEVSKATNITFRIADVTDEQSIKELFQGPAFDVVVANAGAGKASLVRDTELEDWRATLDVNLTGTFLTFRQALRSGMAQGGRLIAIASTSGINGAPTVSAYSAAKHGVLGLVRSLALEVARDGITCNAICPGFVDTDMAQSAIENLMERQSINRDLALSKITSGNPMRT